MPNLKSAITRVNNSARKAKYNKSKKSELKSAIKAAEFAMETSADNMAETLKMTQAKLDKAAARGLIHPNKAAHKKSQLAKKLEELKK